MPSRSLVSLVALVDEVERVQIGFGPECGRRALLDVKRERPKLEVIVKRGG